MRTSLLGFYIFVFCHNLFVVTDIRIKKKFVDAFIIHTLFCFYSFLYHHCSLFIILQVVEQIGLGLHVRLYVPRQKNTAEEWCCVVQNLAATVLLA